MASLLSVDGPTDAVATIVLDRPEKRNALSIQLRDELVDALATLAADERTSVVVVTGRGPVFCAGFDLDEFQVDDPAFQQRLWASSEEYHRAVLEFPLPLVAAVNGPAIAGGFDLAVMCDLRVAAATARFSHPELAFGDVVYGPLHDLVGGAVARDLCLTGRRIDAEEAAGLGVVTTVCDPEVLAATAQGLAAQIARAPRSALLRTKAKIARRAGVAPGAPLDI